MKHDFESLCHVGLGLKEAYRLGAINDTPVFLEEGKDELSFLSSLVAPSSPEMENIQKDFLLLFPYKKERKLLFDEIATLGNNIFLIDFFDSQRLSNPLSQLRVLQYEEHLKEEMETEKIPPEQFEWLNAHFHSLVEKLQFLDFLKGERGLKDKSVRFYLPQVFLMRSDTPKEERTLFATINYIERKILSDYVEKLGIVEKGDSGEAKPVIINL